MATGGLTFRGPFLLVFALGQQVRSVLDLTFVDAPLRPDEFAVYSALRLIGATTPAQLADELGMGRSTLSNRLRKMEDQGHLLRRRHPDDGRSSVIELSPAAVRLTEQCFPAFSRAISVFRAHLDDEEQLLAVLESASGALTKTFQQLSDPRVVVGR